MMCRFMSVTLLTSSTCSRTEGSIVPGVGYRMLRVSGNALPLCRPIAAMELDELNHGYWLTLTSESLKEAYAMLVPSMDGHRATRSWKISSGNGRNEFIHCYYHFMLRKVIIINKWSVKLRGTLNGVEKN